MWGLRREAEKPRPSPMSFPVPPPPRLQTGPRGGRGPQAQVVLFDDDDDDDGDSDNGDIITLASNECCGVPDSVQVCHLCYLTESSKPLGQFTALIPIRQMKKLRPKK